MKRDPLECKQSNVAILTRRYIDTLCQHEIITLFGNVLAVQDGIETTVILGSNSDSAK